MGLHLFASVNGMKDRDILETLQVTQCDPGNYHVTVCLEEQTEIEPRCCIKLINSGYLYPALAKTSCVTMY